MKYTILAIASLFCTYSANAVVTLTIKNYVEASTNGASNGLPIVNLAGVPVPQTPNTVWASAGYFTTLPNFTTATAAQVLASFVALDNTGVLGISARPGLWNAQDYNVSAATEYPAGFADKQLYVVFGNAADVKGSATSIAVFNSGSVFTAFTSGGSQTAILNSTSNVYGQVVALAAQPDSDATPSAFVNGIALISAPVAIPETSTSLLGALGALALLRRRRN